MIRPLKLRSGLALALVLSACSHGGPRVQSAPSLTDLRRRRSAA